MANRLLLTQVGHVASRNAALQPDPWTPFRLSQIPAVIAPFQVTFEAAMGLGGEGNATT
jgi:hypothetical protein